MIEGTKKGMRREMRDVFGMITGEQGKMRSRAREKMRSRAKEVQRRVLEDRESGVARFGMEGLGHLL